MWNYVCNKFLIVQCMFLKDSMNFHEKDFTDKIYLCKSLGATLDAN